MVGKRFISNDEKTAQANTFFEDLNKSREKKFWVL